MESLFGWASSRPAGQGLGVRLFRGRVHTGPVLAVHPSRSLGTRTTPWSPRNLPHAALRLARSGPRVFTKSRLTEFEACATTVGVGRIHTRHRGTLISFHMVILHTISSTVWAGTLRSQQQGLDYVFMCRHYITKTRRSPHASHYHTVRPPPIAEVRQGTVSISLI